MMIPVRCSINIIDMPKQFLPVIKSVAMTIPEAVDWNQADELSDSMKGESIILYGTDKLDSLRSWFDSTEVMAIGGAPDPDMIRLGCFDMLPEPLDMNRFSISFTNMIRHNLMRQKYEVRDSLLKTYFRISDDMLWTKDMQDRHMDINHVLIDLAGKTREEIEGRHEREIYGLAPEDKGCSESDQFVRTSGKTQFFEESMPGADHKQHHLRVTKTPWLDGKGRIIGTVGLAKDMTELLNQQSKFEVFLNSLETGIAITDNSGKIVQVNKILSALCENEKVIEGSQYRDFLEKNFRELPNGSAGDYYPAVPCARKVIWNISSFELRDYWGDGYGYVYILRDVTREREQSQRIKMMAVHDHLTEIANRAGLYEHYDAMDKNAAAAFFFIDGDNFKKVNDDYGHAMGDKFLKDTACIICEQMQDAFPIRLGGDEFFVILPGRYSAEEVQGIADRMQDQVQKLDGYPEGLLGTVGLSIGILLRSDMNDIDAIIERTDQLMYQAKKKGKRCCCIADESVRFGA